MLNAIEEGEEEVEKIPIDRFRAVQFTFFILGCGLLLPYNAFISGADYYELLYPCGHVEFYFSTTYMVTLFFCMVVAVNFGERISFNLRVVPGYIAFFAVLIGSLLTKRLEIHVMMVCITGVADAIVQQAVYSLAATFPPDYIATCMIGPGAAGTIVTVIRMITLAISSSPKESFELFTGLSSCIVLMCLMGWIFVIKSTYGRYYLRFTRTGNRHNTSHNNSNSNISSSSSTSISTINRTESLEQREALAPTKNDDDDDHSDNDDEDEVEMEVMDHKGNRKMLSSSSSSSASSSSLYHLSTWQKYRRIARPIMFPALSIFINFATTLAVFPGVVVEIKPISSIPNFTVALVGVFNIGDLIGRLMVFIKIFQMSPRNLFILSVVRMVFIPMFLIRSLPGHENLGDAYAFIVMILFAISNGHICGVGMMQGPQLVNVELQEAAGTAMAFLLMIGLTFGAIVGMTLNFTLFTQLPCGN